MRVPIVALLLFASVASAQAVAPPAYAIVQGASGNGTAQFSVQVTNGEQLRFAVKLGGGGRALAPQQAERIAHAGSDQELIRLTFVGLPVGIDHQLIVIRDKKYADMRTFSVPDWTAAKGRIAILSCMTDGHPDQQRMWRELLSLKPDALFIIGDSAYCDVVGNRLVREITPELIWRRHAETRQTLELYRASRLVPVFSIWDDHDYGLNDAGREFPHKRASAAIFRAYLPQAPIDGFLEGGPGVSAAFTLFGQRWMLLDGRTFRSPNRREVPDETLFGVRQEAWIVDALRQEPPIWLVTGAQMFNGYHRFESYEACQPNSFKKFQEILRAGKAPFALVTGDRHLAEVSKLTVAECGCDTFEITTSAFHARTFPNAWSKVPNPRQVVGVSGKLNYVVLDVIKDAAALRGTLIVYGSGKAKLFEYEVNAKRGDG